MPDVAHVDGGCPELARTLRALTQDMHRPEDVDTDGPDYRDAARYALLAIGSAPDLMLVDALPAREPIVPEADRIVEFGGVAFQPDDLLLLDRDPGDDVGLDDPLAGSPLGQRPPWLR